MVIFVTINHNDIQYTCLCVTMSAICRQMSCRFDTLADMKIGRVGDMADDMSPTCRRHDTCVCKSEHEMTRHKTTYPAKQKGR